MINDTGTVHVKIKYKNSRIRLMATQSFVIAISFGLFLWSRTNVNKALFMSLWILPPEREKMCIVHVLIETCTPWLICFKLYPQKRKLHKENGKQEDEKLFLANLVLKDM